VSRASAVALSLPVLEGWDFGDYPYSLEPLTLPLPGETPIPPHGVTPAQAEDACLAFLSQARKGFGTTDPAEDLERLFWFRWMIGHHVSFVIWRLLADTLARLTGGEGDQEDASRAIIQYVRAYSGMMLYTGSSGFAIYNDTIRPSMWRQHSTFSGTWALDYPAVRSLFRGRRVPPVADSAVDDLIREIHLGNQIHHGVAQKLVVGGRSLLQRSISERDAAQPRIWGALFDCYFVTVRAPVSWPAVVAQLLRRQKAIAIDLATNGLYPGEQPTSHDLPEELRQPEIAVCEEDLPRSLFRTAGLAAGLPLGRVDKELGTW
jgi:hypothetical protein